MKKKCLSPAFLFVLVLLAISVTACVQATVDHPSPAAPGAPGAPIVNPTTTPAPETSATALSWQVVDIGSAAGTAIETAGVFTLTGKGKFESAQQTFRFLYVPVEGDFTITARLEIFTGSSSQQGKAAVFFTAEQPSATSNDNALRYASSSKAGTGKFEYNHRLEAGKGNGKAELTAPSVSGTKVYLKLVKAGNSYESSYSLDGGVTYGTATVSSFAEPLPDTVYVGLSVNSGDNSKLATAVFSDVRIEKADGSVVEINALSSGGQIETPVSSPSPSPTLAPDSGTGGGSGTGGPVVVPSSPPPISTAPTATDIIYSPVGDPSVVDQSNAITAALSSVNPGQTLFIPAGTYRIDSQITIATGNNGTEDNRKKLSSYNGTVTFDFSKQPYGKTSQVSNPRGLQINGNYWHIFGINFYRSADNGVYVSGNYNVVEACAFYANRDTGLQIGRASSTLSDPATWPSYNLIINCESYDNYDESPNGGENADGFAAKLTCGPGNAFIGCIAHHNVDDGWDLYTKTATGPIGAVLIDSCVAFNNGTLTNGYQNPSGDRNGFKLGGEKISVPHVVTRSIAFDNGKDGFTWNSNQGKIRMFNNTAWGNVQENYKFDGDGSYYTTPVAGKSSAIFYNNLSFGSPGSDRAGHNSGKVIERNVFWHKSSPFFLIPTELQSKGIASLSANNFEATTLSLPLVRKDDGSFDLGGLAKPKALSPLIGAGYLYNIEADYGMPVEGGVPELTYNPATAWGGSTPNLGAR